MEPDKIAGRDMIRKIISPIVNGKIDNSQYYEIRRELIQMACMGNTDAQYILFFLSCFNNQECGEEEWFWGITAASKGNVEAQYDLGLYYLYDESKDEKEERIFNGIGWLECAARNYNQDAIRKVINIYGLGVKVKCNSNRAESWKRIEEKKNKKCPLLLKKHFLFDENKIDEEKIELKEVCLTYKNAMERVFIGNSMIYCQKTSYVCECVERLLGFGVFPEEILVIYSKKGKCYEKLGDDSVEKIYKSITQIIAHLENRYENHQGNFLLTENKLEKISKSDIIYMLSEDFLDVYLNYEKIKYVYIDQFCNYDNEQKLLLLSMMEQMKKSGVSFCVVTSSIDFHENKCKNSAGIKFENQCQNFFSSLDYLKILS